MRGLKNRPAGAEQRRMVTELVPNSYTAHYAYGNVLASLGDFDAAIASIRTALRLNPIFADAHHRLAMIYLRKGDTDQALLLQQGKAVKAEEIYRRGLTFRPNNRALRYNLALLLAKQRRFDEAIEDIQTGLKSDPNSAGLLELLDAVKKAKIKGVGNNSVRHGICYILTR